MHRALLKACPAPGAAVVVELIALPSPELDHRVLRARAQTAVALAAVAARKTPAGLERRLLGRQATDHLGEPGDALLRRKLGRLPTGGVTEEPQIEHRERRHVV